MRPQQLKKLIFAALGGILWAILACGCEGGISVQGRVYASPSRRSTGSSFAIVDTVDRLPPAHLVPLKEIEVTVEPWSPSERAKINSPNQFTMRTRTDKSGYFRINSLCRPGKFTATITVRQRGLTPVEQTFVHRGFEYEHWAVVVLVPESSAGLRK